MSIWGPALTLGGGLLSGYSKAKSAAATDAANKQEDRYASRNNALYQGILSQFQSDLDYRDEQRNRANKQRGLAEFRKFSNVASFAPNYAQTNADIVIPVAPDINTILPAVEQYKAPKVKTGVLGKVLGGLF